MKRRRRRRKEEDVLPPPGGGGGRAAPAPPPPGACTERSEPRRGGAAARAAPGPSAAPGRAEVGAGPGGSEGRPGGGRERPPAWGGPVLTPLSRVTSGRHGRAPPGRSLPLLGYLRAVRVLELLDLHIARFAPFFPPVSLSGMRKRKCFVRFGLPSCRESSLLRWVLC